MTDTGNVIYFPRQMRVVPTSSPYTAPAKPSSVVEHDGKLYPLEPLLRGLTEDEPSRYRASRGSAAGHPDSASFSPSVAGSPT